jgi:FkbM family methyltransferase
MARGVNRGVFSDTDSYNDGGAKTCPTLWEEHAWMSLISTLRFITGHPLNRGNELGSILRFLRWQLASRMMPGTVVFEWLGGSRFLVRNGETGLTGNIYTGLHEFPEMGFLLHFLRQDDLFVDVGANVGSYTILACKVVGARGIAFEPIPTTFDRLVENIRLNRLENRVACLNQGVGAHPGTVRFSSDSDTTNHALSAGEKSDKAIDVTVTTLDHALQNEQPSLLKIDVEGYEPFVLQGAGNTLAKPSLAAVIMELNGSGTRYGRDESEILELMFGYGFRTYSYCPLRRKLVDLEGKNLASGNTLFVRDKAVIEERVQTASIVSVLGREL